MTASRFAKENGAIFVTGTDTDCGKTFVSSALICALKNLGYRVIGMKPVASGSEWKNGSLVNSDVESLKYFANVALPDRIINPYIYEPAISPHFAAELADSPVVLDKIVDAYTKCLNAADIVIVEGAGGWRVPLGENLDMSKLVQTLNIPVLLVSGLKLGSINHTLLSAESIMNDGLDLLGWVANLIDPNYANIDATIEHIGRKINVPLVGQLGRYDADRNLESAIRQAAKSIDLQQLEERIWDKS